MHWMMLRGGKKKIPFVCYIIFCILSRAQAPVPLIPRGEREKKLRIKTSKDYFMNKYMHNENRNNIHRRVQEVVFLLR